MYWLFLFLGFASCASQKQAYSPVVFFQEPLQKPIIVIAPITDQIQNAFSLKATQSLAQITFHRLSQKNIFSFSSSKPKGKHFLIQMNLTDYTSTQDTLPELSLGINLKIIEVQLDKTKIIFQDTLAHKTLLSTPLSQSELLSWDNETFKISPLGLAHNKLSRELALRIEEYILLAPKG